MKSGIVVFALLIISALCCPPIHSQAWKELLDRADSLCDYRSEFSSADSLGRLSLKLVEEELGSEDTAVAKVLSRLAIYNVCLQHVHRADSLSRRALAIYEGASTSNHLCMLEPLNTIAWVHRLQTNLDSAEALLLRTVAICESADSSATVDCAECLRDLASMYMRDPQKQPKGLQLYAQAIDFIEKRLGGEVGWEHVALATTLLHYGNGLRQLGQPDTAASCMGRAMRICENDLARSRNLYASCVQDLASLYIEDMNRRSEALELVEHAVEISDIDENSNSMTALEMWELAGSVHQLLGNYRESAHYFERALRLAANLYGPSHPKVAKCRSNLAVFYYLQHEFSKTEECYRRNIEMSRAILASGDCSRQSIMNAVISTANLGCLYHYMEKHSAAAEQFATALAVWLSAYGVDEQGAGQTGTHLNSLLEATASENTEMLCQNALTFGQTVADPDLEPLSAWLLMNVGRHYRALGDFDSAERLFLESYELFKRNDTVYKDAASDLIGLARIYTTQGKFAEADSFASRAANLQEMIYGPKHPNVAVALTTLARVHMKTGELDVAEPALNRARGIISQSLGVSHIRAARYLTKHCELRRLQGRFDEARELAKQSFDIKLKTLKGNAMVLSEYDALSVSRGLHVSADHYLSAFYDDIPKHEQEIDDAASLVLQCKGLITDCMLDRQQAIATESDSVTQSLADSLISVKSRLARMYVGKPDQGVSDPDSVISQLQSEANDLESALARHSASFRTRLDQQDVSSDRLSNLLPKGTALVEFLQYNYIHTNMDDTVPRYLAVVLRPDEAPAIELLGDASDIDELISDYHQHIHEVLSTGTGPIKENEILYKDISSKLCRKLWKPLEIHLDDARLVFIAPDGHLNSVAFAGLSDSEGVYLVEKTALHYLTSGRDLIRLTEDEAIGQGLFAMGDPAYSATVDERVLAMDTSPDHIQDTILYATRNARSECATLADIVVSPLPGTRKEIETAAAAWTGAGQEPVEAWFGTEATEDNFKSEAPGNRVIHVATHAYYLPSDCQSAGYEGDYVTWENPLLRSGLFFAGANLHGEGADSAGVDDGVLTAYEVSAMNLEGTELAILSACETGLGELQTGEGVYGLRRAFQMAGVRTLVTTLWPVADESTAEFMTRLYDRKDETWPEWMQKIQTDKINEQRKQGLPDHPIEWGAFSVIGDWR